MTPDAHASPRPQPDSPGPAEPSLQESIVRLAQAEQLAHVGHWDWRRDRNPNELTWSEETYRIFGRSPAGFLPTVESFEACIHPDDLAAFVAERERALREGDAARIEHRILRPDGEIRHVRELAEFVRNASGAVVHVRGTVQDITDQQRQSEELRRSEERYRSIVGVFPDPLCRWAPDTVLTYVNQHYRDLFAAAGAELIGRSWIDFVPEESRQIVREFYERLRRQPGPVVWEHQVTLKDGSNRWYQWIDSPLCDEAGHLVEFQSVGHDITAFKTAQQDLTEQQQDLRRLVRERTTEIESLSKITAEMIQHLPLADRAPKMLKAIVEHAGVDLAMLFVREEEQIRLVDLAMRDTTARHDSPACRRLGECLCGLAGLGEPVYSHNILQDERCVHLECRRAGMRSFAALPLAMGPSVRGVLCVATAAVQDLRARETFFSLLARDVAVGMLNSLLYEDASRHVIALEAEIIARRRAEEDAHRTSAFREAIIERAAEGICVSRGVPEAAGVRFSVWNNRMTDITGYTMEEINRLGWFTAVHPGEDRRSRAIERMARLSQGEDLRAEEWTITRKDGSERTLAVSTRALEDGQVLAMMHDLTDRRHAEDALRASEERFRTLVEQSSDIYALLDAEGCIRYQSPSTTAITGYGPDEVSGMSVFRFVHPEDAARLRRDVLQVMLRQPGAALPFQCRVRHKRGRWLTISGNGCNCLNVPGVASLVINCRDVTAEVEALQAQRRAEAELAAQRAQAMRADRLRSLGEMAAGIAHELNQPLGGIRALAEQNVIALRRNWTICHIELAQELQMMIDQADRMSRIINHVRSFSRQASAPDAKPSDLNEIIQGSLGLVREQLLSAGIAVTLDLASPLPPVAVNPFSMEEVFLNLLSNARHAIESAGLPGGGAIAVRTTPCDEGRRQWVRAEVADTGAGIPAEIMDRIFEPFFTTKGPDHGTGLGLPICRSIVESFGGRIRIESQPGSGARAVILLPRGDAKEAAQ